MFPNPTPTSTGLSFLRNINFAGILDGTQKTLGVINQAIPIVYQVKPIVSNLGTIFKISNILNDNKPATPADNYDSSSNDNKKNSPIFYV